jgi:hypothetical protein
MELSKITYNNLVSLIDNAKKNKNYELEARIWNKNMELINEESYTRLFQKLTFSKIYNGFGYNYEMKNILDVFLDRKVGNKNYDNESIRMSINDEDNIKKYWLTSSTDNLNPTFIEKEKIDKIDDNNYNIRFSLNNEIPKNNILEKNIELLTDKNKNRNTIEKVFRFKNRYSIKTDDNLFLIEISKIKYGTGKTFKESNTLKNKVNYEVEIEFIGRESKLTTVEIADKLLLNCFNILKILHNTNIIIPANFKNKIKAYYKELIGRSYDDFIAASPVTIHRENLFRTDVVPNIYNQYAVTLKADGQRFFLIVFNNGKIYLFNVNFDIIDTGYTDESWNGTLLEGEFIVENNEVYLYDTLFSHGQDVRKRYLTDIKDSNKKMKTRLDILNDFIKSPTRKVSENFTEDICVKLKNKKYIQTVRNDGTDIFQKTKELWDSRGYNTFNVDGIIFVPKYEYYPLKGGSWDKLFKWKPPVLNTIDFLSKTIKDDLDNDVRSPYIEVITRIDGKKENILKQYKTFKLYVTGLKTIYENQKNTKIRIPVLFNPFKLDEKNSEVYNLAKVFIEDDGKIYATDPITNEKVEINDDIIIEWGYDETKEDGFKWIPYRYRRDKTAQYINDEKMFGNSERTANDIFRSIKLPITEDMITTGNIPTLQEDKDGIIENPYYVREDNNNGKRKRFPYQNFHNLYVKYQLLYFSSPSYIKEIGSGYHGKILDLCCGRGVDYTKIKNARYEEIIGMDIDFENIKIAQDIFKARYVPPPKAYYVRGDSSKLIWPEQASAYTEVDKIKTKKFIPVKYMFDTISLQFCFHYFFKDEISFRTILQNLNDNLKIGGFVIGTTFDGERIYNSFKDKDSISGKDFSGELMWRIEKKYKNKKISFTEKLPNFGRQIDVLVKTIGVVHPEYLVNFKYLIKLMEEYGFSMVFIKPFEELYQEIIDGKNLMNQDQRDLEKCREFAKEMSDAEKTFSFFFSAFMFKKERNSSDSLLKKLVELMEKQDKVKITMDSNVYKVNKDTEEIILNVEESE